MTFRKTIFLSCMLIIGVFFLVACAGAPGPVGPAGPAGPVGPTGPAGPAGISPAVADLACTQCHNKTTMLEGKIYAWEGSRHGTAGLAWEEEAGNKTCAGCHEGSSFIDRVAAGQSYAEYTAAMKDLQLPDATPQTCRACHMIHTTYTPDDFGLRTVVPVTMVVSGQTFDKGLGNLCVQCHQARRYMADFPAKDEAGNLIAGSYAASTRFNPHFSNQADMLLGVGGGGTVTGSPAGHYTMTTDSCVTCHLGESANHTLDPNVSTCVACHPDAKDIDINGTRTKIEEKYNALKDGLTKAGLLDAEGSPVAGNYEEAKAFPLWVYGYITEDGSMGTHNTKYATALLDAALEGMK